MSALFGLVPFFIVGIIVFCAIISAAKKHKENSQNNESESKESIYSENNDIDSAGSNRANENALLRNAKNKLHPTDDADLSEGVSSYVPLTSSISKFQHSYDEGVHSLEHSHPSLSDNVSIEYDIPTENSMEDESKQGCDELYTKRIIKVEENDSIQIENRNDIRKLMIYGSMFSQPRCKRR